MKNNKVVAQTWNNRNSSGKEEYHNTSLHLNQNSRDSFIREEYDGRSMDNVPSVYIFNSGGSFLALVDDRVFQKIKNSENGIFATVEMFEKAI